MLVASLVVSTPLLWGWEVRHHRDARVTAETLAEMEHELAATRAAHAVETERRKIAHDLHDVIAGHLQRRLPAHESRRLPRAARSP